MMEAKGVIYVELTMGSEILATIFTVDEVQGNYNVILGFHLGSCQPMCANYILH